MVTKNLKGNDGGEGEIACSLWVAVSTKGRARRARGRAGRARGRARGGRWRASPRARVMADVARCGCRTLPAVDLTRDTAGEYPFAVSGIELSIVLLVVATGREKRFD